MRPKMPPTPTPLRKARLTKLNIRLKLKPVGSALTSHTQWQAPGIGLCLVAGVTE